MVRAFPELAPGHSGLGVALHRLGRVEEALERFYRVLQIDLDYPEVYINIGIARTDQGHLQDALDAFQRALDANPQSPVALTQLGVIHRRLGRNKEAFPYFLRALAIAPKEPVIHNALGYSYAVAGETEKVRTHYERALESDPASAEVHFNLARTLLRSGDYGESAAHFESAVAHAGESPLLIQASLRSAWVLSTAPDDSVRDGPKAVRVVERVCHGERREAPRCCTVLAACYAEVGEFEKAVATAESGIAAAVAANAMPTAEGLRGYLEFYQRRQPYRMPTVKTSDAITP